MFEKIEAAPSDPILGLTEAFKADTHSNKINLGVGVYKNERGETPIFAAVKEAEKRILKAERTKSYLPIPGKPEFGQKVQSLLFEKPVIARTAHTPGGTGALRLGSDFIHKMMPKASIWVSSPTWGNHNAVFTAANLSVKKYPYYDPETKKLDAENMLEILKNVPAGDFVLLHVCCHNPTGVDLHMEQWTHLAQIAKTAGWIPFFDFAYQGFSEGIEKDREPFQPFLDAHLNFFIANSFSKNLGLYNERVGGFTFVSNTTEQADAVFSQVKRMARANYSNPPFHGEIIVIEVMEDEVLKLLWIEELSYMRDRIKVMRSELANGLQERNPEVDFSFIKDQRGMFSNSGLNEKQVKFLRDKKGIYIVGDGRINVAGITPQNINYLCDAIVESLH